jgi:hypothetical protein
MIKQIWFLPFAFLLTFQTGCAKKGFQDGSVVVTNNESIGKHITLSFTRGSAWGHEVHFGPMKLKIRPQIAVWVEDTAGNLKQNLYVTKCFAKQKWYGIKNHPDSTYRTSSLPYWMNKLVRAGQQLPTQAHPLPDAVTAATPDGSFTIESVIDSSVTAGSIVCEFNSSFDNNDAWPAKKNHMESFNGQPSLVFKGNFSPADTSGTVTMNYAGRGGENGSDGNLYENDNRITTAKEIITKIEFKVN